MSRPFKINLIFIDLLAPERQLTQCEFVIDWFVLFRFFGVEEFIQLIVEFVEELLNPLLYVASFLFRIFKAVGPINMILFE